MPVEDLQKLADDAGIPLVYDAAHALGTSRAGRPIGGFGVAEVFSMSPTKVTMAGEGGLVTHDADLAARRGSAATTAIRATTTASSRPQRADVRAARGGGARRPPTVDERVAYRDDLVDRLPRPGRGRARAALAALDEGDVSTYKDLTLILDPDVFGLTTSSWGGAEGQGIDSRRYYSPPIHRQQAYAHLRGQRELPVTDEMADRVLTPPLYSHMTGRAGAAGGARRGALAAGSWRRPSSPSCCVTSGSAAGAPGAVAVWCRVSVELPRSPDTRTAT